MNEGCDGSIKFINKDHAEFYTGRDDENITFTFTPVFDDVNKTIKFTNVKTAKTDAEIIDFISNANIDEIVYPVENSIANISLDAKKISNIRLMSAFDDGELVKEECKDTYTLTHVA